MSEDMNNLKTLCVAVICGISSGHSPISNLHKVAQVVKEYGSTGAIVSFCWLCCSTR